MNGILQIKIAKNTNLMKYEAILVSFCKLSKMFGLRFIPYDFIAKNENEMYATKQKNIASKVEKYPFLLVFTSS